MSQISGKFIQNSTITLNKLGQNGATNNQVITWNGSAWVPATVSGSVDTTVAQNTLAGLNALSTGSTLQEVLNRLYGPTISQAPVFATDGTLTSVTYYQGPTQTTPNRVAAVNMTYDANLDPATETTILYSYADGTTILKTITRTYTFTSGALTNVTKVTT